MFVALKERLNTTVAYTRGKVVVEAAAAVAAGRRRRGERREAGGTRERDEETRVIDAECRLTRARVSPAAPTVWRCRCRCRRRSDGAVCFAESQWGVPQARGTNPPRVTSPPPPQQSLSPAPQPASAGGGSFLARFLFASLSRPRTRRFPAVRVPVSATVSEPHAVAGLAPGRTFLRVRSHLNNRCLRPYNDDITI